MVSKRISGLIMVAVLLGMYISSGMPNTAAHQRLELAGRAAAQRELAVFPFASPSPTAACGPAWNVISTTNVLTLTNQFRDVAVSAPDDVWAVGYYEGVNYIPRSLTEHWDGYSWSAVAAANNGANENRLNAVAAATISDVWAVGFYSATNAYQTLTERWDGASWQVVPSPNAGSSDNFLYGVAAYSGTVKYAVGSHKSSSIADPTTLAEMWNGSAWQVVTSTNPGNGNNVLNAVAVSSSDAWAVGYYDNIAGKRHTLIEHWNGSGWDVSPSPNVGTDDNILLSVVAEPGGAWAVGYYNVGADASPLIERWDGSTWQVVANPPLTGIGVLNDISETASNDIWVVGGVLNGLHPATPADLKQGDAVDGFATLIEHWNGSTWSLVPSPSVGNDSYLQGVAAVNANDVWTVGYYNDGTGRGQILAERYTGNCVPTPTPTITPTVTVTPTDCPNPFTDINGNTFYFAIHYLYCRGVVNGTGGTTFSPAGTSTRGQFAKVVVLGFGIAPYTPTGAPDFTDVPPSYFAYAFIEAGFHAGILGGFTPAQCTAIGATYPCYGPNIAITRGQITKLVVSAAHYALVTPVGGGQTYTDVPPSNPFYLFIETAHYKSVVNGYPDGTFRPNANIQRDQMCQIVYKGVTTP